MLLSLWQSSINSMVFQSGLCSILVFLVPLLWCKRKKCLSSRADIDENIEMGSCVHGFPVQKETRLSLAEVNRHSGR
jgi:hypothetical protein